MHRERYCSAILARTCDTAIRVGSKSVVLILHKSQQQAVNDSRASPTGCPYRILTLLSNYENLLSALPSLKEDGCTHTVKSVLQPAKRSSYFATRVGSHKIRFSHSKIQIEEATT